MKQFTLIFFLVSMFLLSGCTDDASGENKRIDYNYLGDAFCKCAQPTIQLNEELQVLQKTDKQAFLGKLKEAGDKAKESLSCCKQSMKNHTTAIPKRKDLKKALKNECAGIPDQMLDEIVMLISEEQ